MVNVPQVTSQQYLEIREVFSHEAVDLADWQASSFTVLQSHEDQDAAEKEENIFTYLLFQVTCLYSLESPHLQRRIVTQ